MARNPGLLFLFIEFHYTGKTVGLKAGAAHKRTVNVGACHK